MNFLLIGSGSGATAARSWDLSQWDVGAIHNAWSVAPDLTKYHFVSGDFVPAKGNSPTLEFNSKVRKVSYKDYDGPVQRERFGRQEYGIGATMFFNAAYWVLGELRPSVIGFLGCSMDYGEDGAPNTFYGAGSPDPVRFGRRKLEEWFSYLQDFATNQGCELVNFGLPGIMPYERRTFPYNKPLI